MIYLATDSRARRKLFTLFGLKFKIISSGVAEKTRAAKRSYAQLVIDNAVAKASAVAVRLRSRLRADKGAIVAADTVVVCNGRIFGKPKDLAHARRMLKELSRKAQWVYTGVCVIDGRTGRMKTACERTRIFMDALTDKEISRYFRQVSPLDKAGSFDIQGKGAFFIRRIEGCFYNVVGLPLRTLYRMFKELKINVFMAVLCAAGLAASLLSAGCASEYNLVTQKQESYYYSTDQEVRMGQSIAKQIENQYKLDNDVLVQSRVRAIGEKIVAVSDRKDIAYSFKVLDEKEVNAVSLPGGPVYIFKGLLDRVDNDNELAAVIAHEVAHIVARHSIKKIQAVQGYNLLRLLAIPVPDGGKVIAAADLAVTDIILGYGREDELLADQLGARYAQAAGYDPQAMISFLEKLQEYHRGCPLQPKNYLKTHPYVPDRIRVVKKELGQPFDFDDYINVEQKEHE